MRNPCFRKSVYIAVILGLAVVISGCETVGAMKTGDIKMEDLVQMAKATLPNAGARPKATNSGASLGMELTRMDAWFKDNLW